MVQSAQRICSVKGCNRKVHAKGLCQKHYDAARKNRSGGSEEPRTCRIPGCRDPHHAQGLCQKHYDQWRKKEAAPVRTPRIQMCKVPTCPERAVIAGYCRRHFERRHKRRMVLSGQPNAHPVPIREGGCAVPGCSAPHHAKGYCKTHYSQIRRYGEIKNVRRQASGGRVCSFPKCSKPAVVGTRCKEHAVAGSTAPKRIPKSRRLDLIRRRHELMKREIEAIRAQLEREEEVE